jgi:hypothetical protein
MVGTLQSATGIPGEPRRYNKIGATWSSPDGLTGGFSAARNSGLVV